MRILIRLSILLFLAAPLAAQVAGLTITRDIRHAAAPGTTALLQSLDVYRPPNGGKKGSAPTLPNQV